MAFVPASASGSATAVDQTYGQRSVFGGGGVLVTAPDDADLDCEDEHEAMAYLQRVRYVYPSLYLPSKAALYPVVLTFPRDEASRIPHVMVAPRHGPQAFPPGFGEDGVAVKLGPRAKRRQRIRHWDEQDDGVPADSADHYGADDGSAAKRRRVSRPATAAAGLSYDDESQPGAGEDIQEEDARDDEDEDKAPYEPEYTPQLFDRSLYENGIGDARGYYQDGAYVAAPNDGHEDDTRTAALGTGENGESRQGPANGSRLDDSTVDDEAAAASFSAAYRSRLLLAHFADMRALLRPMSHFSSIPEQLPTLPPDHDTDVGPLSTRSGVFRRWLHLLRTTDPLPLQIAAMDKLSVLRLLRVLLRGLLAGGGGGSGSSASSRSARFERSLVGSQGMARVDMTPRTSRWLWALFARLPDRGELDYREVGYIRDVAKQAVMRLAHLSYDMGIGGGEAEEEGGEQEEEEGENGGGYEDTDGVIPDQEEASLADAAMDIESEGEVDPGEGGAGDSTGQTVDDTDDAGDAEDEQTRAAVGDTDVDMHQRATLEMVLAVVGELYGQRDLLVFRGPWPRPGPP